MYNDNGTTLKQIIPNSETDDTTPKFTVKVESHASLTIYDNGVAISMIEIGDLGKNTTWSFTLNKELSLGKHTITLIQKDAAGLPSEESASFTFYVVAPKVASTSEVVSSDVNEVVPSVTDSVGLNTLKLAQTTTNEMTSQQQKSVSLHDLLKSSSTDASDPIAKILSVTDSKPVVNEQSEVNNIASDVTTNLEQLLPNTTSSPLQNILEQTYPVV